MLDELREDLDESYLERLGTLQAELVKMLRHVRATNQRLVLLFEGRDAAGKGGTIMRLTQYLNPRFVRVVALQKPSPREQGQWYFQRYVTHLPGPGEIVCFDRSWYNRAVVEPALGYCNEAQYDTFMRSVGPFEQLLVDDGVILAKYWLSIRREEQRVRLDARERSPLTSWKLSPTDRLAHDRWEDLTRYKAAMFERSHTEWAPWHLVDGNDKKAARLAVLRHVLTLVDYPDASIPVGEGSAAVELVTRFAP